MTAYEYGYARISTTQHDLARQLDALRSAGIPEERIYRDGRPGEDFEHQQLAVVLALLRPGDLLTLPEFDRIGRTFLRCVGAFNMLRERGVHIRALDGPLSFDTRNGDDPQALLVIAMGGAVAQLELKFQRERRASVRASRETRGAEWGRPREVDRPAVLAELARLEIEGVTANAAAREVASTFKIGRATVFRIKAEAKSAPAPEPVVEDVVPRRPRRKREPLVACCSCGESDAPASTGLCDPCTARGVHVEPLFSDAP
ncbi:recombinase family protein [Kitasatospora sp. NPDC059160]|uniref:recombinase family protein n=1 Tax=Kitasatospora sp. NPDC059160 TaxID=3346748 RepID=UPI0036AC9C56